MALPINFKNLKTVIIFHVHEKLVSKLSMWFEKKK